MTEREIFFEALAKSSGEERLSFLDLSCGRDSELRHRVDSLLAICSEEKQFMQRPAVKVESAYAGEETIEGPGSVIGHYRLLEQIGEGGFGTVYLAEQGQPVKRRVALKILKAGMDTRQVIARFEAERQALALMDHPNIATVHDAGTTDKGRPFFVMELVSGKPITQFCDEKQLSVRERIELLIPVCQAIQHAHQKGIIHRDIKPSNVLVATDSDSTGERSDTESAKARPMVIDFGVAKAIHQRLTEKTVYTQQAQMIGTPAYVSPEQAGMRSGASEDVDTRTDVYSLGVLLYELLVGTTPFSPDRLKDASYPEIERAIREQEPLRPSKMLDQLKGTGCETAANRRCEPAKLSKIISGDIDWIVLKALEKDRNRRYATALELAADLERYLTDQPVTAAAPSAFYRCGKFVRRNRPAVVAGVAVALAVAAGLTSVVWHAHRVNQERANAEAALEFVSDLLAQADPTQGQQGGTADRDLKLRSALQQAADNIGDRYISQPVAEGYIRLTIGQALEHLGERTVAKPHIELAYDLLYQHLGPSHEKTLEAGWVKAKMLVEEWKFEEAAKLSREVALRSERALGPGHERTLRAMNCNAHALLRAAKNDEALRVYKEVVERCRKYPQTSPQWGLGALEGIAGVYYDQGDHDEYYRIKREVYEVASRTLGEDHYTTLRAAVDCVNGLRLENRLSEARDMAQEVEPRCLRVLGNANPTTVLLQSEMVLLDVARGLRYVPRQRRFLESTEQALGTNNYSTVFEQMRLGLALQLSGDLSEAELLLKEATSRIQQLEGTNSLMSRRGLRWLSGVHISQERFGEAERLLRQVIEARRSAGDLDSTPTDTSHRMLASVYARQGKWPAAAEQYLIYATQAPTQYKYHAAALQMSALAANRQSIERVVDLIRKRFRDAESTSAARHLSQSLLLTAPLHSDTGMALQLADRVLSSPDHASRAPWLAGLVAYRRGEWNRALEVFTKHVDNPFKATPDFAPFFLAMAQFQQGNRGGAEETWRAANDRLEAVLRHGDLGNTTTYPELEWVPFASAILARNEAQELIFSQPVSPEINQGYLTEARHQWRPVRLLMEKAYSSARSQDWEGAKKWLLEATAHERFDWGAAVYRFPKIIVQAALVLLLANDQSHYESLCESLAPFVDHELEEHAEVFLLSAPHSPSDSIRATLDRLRGAGASMPSDPERRHRLQGVIGRAAYRAGEDSEALDALTEAASAYNLGRSGCAHAFAAMAASNLEQKEVAAQHFDRAEEVLEELLTDAADDLGPDWHRTATLMLALREARR